METYIQENAIQNKDDLWKFCNMFLRYNLASTDGIIVKKAYDYAKDDDLKSLLHLEKICHGIKLSSEIRQSSMMMGRQFFQAVRELTDDLFIATWHEKLMKKEIKGHFSVVYGIYTARLRIDQLLAIKLFLQSSITALVQNGVRSIPLGQMSGVQTINRLLKAIDDTAKHVMTLNLDDLNNHALALEIASMKHEYLYSRLFIS